MSTQNTTPTITQLRTITFQKEQGRWFLKSEEWVELQTRIFRQTHTYLNEKGKMTKYNEVQDFSDPYDDHTKHPEWSDPRWSEALVADGPLVTLIEQKAHGALRVQIDFISYGWVSDTFAHYQLEEVASDGARYKARFATSYPETLHLKPVFHFLFANAYPRYLHVK